MKKLKGVFSIVLILLVAALFSCNNNTDVVDEEIYYTVDFDSQGGSSVPSQNVKKNSGISKPENPTKEGYDFDNWYVDNSYSATWSFAEDMVISNITLYAKWNIRSSVVEKYTITFDSQGGTLVSSIEIEKNTIPTKPENPTKDGYMFVGWSKEIDGSIYDFTQALDTDTTLYAKWLAVSTEISYYQAGNESYAIEFTDSNIKNTKAYYKKTSATEYTQLDNELIRSVDDKTARIDFLGLEATTYDFKIKTSSGNELLMPNQTITAYDRSGYAHFNFTSGVGAYKDDGTLKDDAIVIYLTNENKDTIQVPGYESAGTGIGYILNNAQYSKAGSDTYTPNADNLGIYPITKEHPVVIRIIGVVEAPKGLTAYNSTKNGGTVGDNGFMARMKNASNVTIEGVGEDAAISGWGIHFICSDSSKGGSSFEVRNLTFTSYPEDALGMEGVQEGQTLTSPVSRCWIHHNTFLPGYCANPAESDKAEGDGSCDFKRGEYYTLSYNYFTDCHKTNLIGSSDSSLQYNISMHHNWWNNCSSRIPLVRNANVHYYNNYVSVDAKSKPSYVISARANSYVFSEANYFEGCKNNVQLASGGIVKSYNDTYYACYENNSATKVTSRTDLVANNCKYQTFDTSETQFYYDAVNKKSDCYITDSVTARNECIKYAGVKKRVYTDSEDLNEVTPENSVVIQNDSLTIDLASVTKNSSIVSNVHFNNISGVSSGTIKFKGQGITFTLSSEAELVVKASAKSTDCLGELVKENGEVIASKFSDLTVVLEAGTYFIASGNLEKELTVTLLQFNDTKASSEARLQAYNEAIALIPETITLSEECKALIDNALKAYNSLTNAEKEMVSTYNLLSEALEAYNNLAVANVIDLINAIGTVTKDSQQAISNARKAYQALDSKYQANVTNYQNLVEAIQAYEEFEIQNIIEIIDNLVDYNEIDIANKTMVYNGYEDYNNIYLEYSNLVEEKKVLVTNSNKVILGLEKFDYLLAPYNLNDLIVLIPATITQNDYANILEAKDLYNSLDETQKAILSLDEVSKLKAAIEEIEGALANKVVHNFTESGITSSFFTITGSLSTQKGTVEYGGLTLTQCLKIESDTTITFTTVVKMTLTLVFSTSGKIKINGTRVESAQTGILTIELEAGNHTITKDSSLNLFYMELV